MNVPTPLTSTTTAQIDRLEVNASWLLRLRWVAVVGQLLTIGVAVLLLGVGLQVAPLLLLVAFTAATNVVFAVWVRIHVRRPERAAHNQRVLASVMAVDLITLTTLLYYSGGPANPFTIFYFVNLSLAAVVLPIRWSWGLLIVALGCLAFLSLQHVAVPELQRAARIASIESSLQSLGLVAAVLLCAGVAIYFITRVTSELQERDQQLRVAEQERARSERLEALATLAAGAGHELASPLSTIAVIANDLAKHLEGTDVPESVIEDVGLIRSELDHCRRILDDMASGAGEAMGEAARPITSRQLVAEILDGLRRRDRVDVGYPSDFRDPQLIVPVVATSQAIRGLVRNGLDASGATESVELSVDANSNELTIVVSDRGTGMPDDVLTRAREPFFTTKEPGSGMGLGLFLTQNVVQRIGGELEIASTAGVGTTATVRLPLAG